MSGLNFNNTDNKLTTITDDAYTQVTLSDTSENHDYDLRGITNNLSIRAGQSSVFTGFRAKYDGQLLTVTNRIAPGKEIKIAHLNSNSSSQVDLTSNKGIDLIISYGCSVVLRYDNTVSKWWLISYFEVV